MNRTLALFALLLVGWTQDPTEDEDFGGDVPEFEEQSLDEQSFGGDFEEAPIAAPLGESHDVAPGDTLWDLSEQFLNNPWYWPKVWSYNPQLTNPHWIYPGNQLRFYPSDENLPTAVDVSAEGFEEEDLSIPGVVADEDLVRSVGSFVTADDVPGSVWTAYRGFVATGPEEFTGRITNAFVDSSFLSSYDRIYVKLRTAASEGEKLGVYRRSRRVIHPVTGRFLGWSVEFVGHVRVAESNPRVTTCDILQTYRQIERGDYVGPLPESWGQRISPSPATSEAKGFVVETVDSVLGLIGEHQPIYVDLGRDQGVQIGNVLTVLKRGDEYTGKTVGLPFERVGKVVIVDVRNKMSTGIVVDSMREISIGDRVVMETN